MLFSAHRFAYNFRRFLIIELCDDADPSASATSDKAPRTRCTPACRDRATVGYLAFLSSTMIPHRSESSSADSGELMTVDGSSSATLAASSVNGSIVSEQPPKGPPWLPPPSRSISIIWNIKGVQIQKLNECSPWTYSYQEAVRKLAERTERLTVPAIRSERHIVMRRFSGLRC